MFRPAFDVGVEYGRAAEGRGDRQFLGDGELQVMAGRTFVGAKGRELPARVSLRERDVERETAGPRTIDGGRRVVGVHRFFERGRDLDETERGARTGAEEIERGAVEA